MKCDPPIDQCKLKEQSKGTEERYIIVRGLVITTMYRNEDVTLL